MIRTAGHRIDSIAIASVEYAVSQLGVRLIMVLGHTECGAVKAAIEHIESNDKLPGSIGDLIDPIRPVVRSVAGRPGNKFANVTKANVLAGESRRGVPGCRGLDVC